MRDRIQINPNGLLRTLFLTLLLIGLYYNSWAYLFGEWNNEDFTYCYLVPLIVLYLVWEKRQELSSIPLQPTWWGLLPVLAGMGLYLLGELGGEYTALFISFWLVLVGVVWALLGTAVFKAVRFPLAFLLAAFTPPDFIYFGLTLRLKLISSQIGVWLLQAYGMSAYREGNIIDLGFTQLQVVDACSGLRYLLPLLIMAVLLAYLYKSAWWKKVVLVVSAVPLTIGTNSLRIAMTGILYEIWGPAVAEDFFHGFSGWLIFIFGLAVLLVEMWVMKKIFPEEKFSSVHGSRFTVHGQSEAAPDPKQAVAKDDAPQDVHPGPIDSTLKPETLNLKPAAATGIRSLLHPPQFIVAVVLLAGTLAAAQGIEFREKIPPAQSFASFPTQIGEWTGKREAMEQKFIDGLHFSDYVIVDYANGGHAVNFYTAYYESQRKGESIHSPETCLPGGGWEFKNAGSVELPLKARGGEPMRVNKALMVKGNAKQLSYFWFPQRDRVLTNAWELKWYNFWDALTRQRTDGALVRLITPVYQNEGVEEADRRLVAFTKEIVPVLNEFLPK